MLNILIELGGAQRVVVFYVICGPASLDAILRVAGALNVLQERDRLCRASSSKLDVIGIAFDGGRQLSEDGRLLRLLVDLPSE